MSDLTTSEATHLRVAIDLAHASLAAGNLPFGAVIAAADGTVLAEGHNTTRTQGDATAHAELNAIRLASHSVSPAELATATLYASTEPCAMCAAAAYIAGIGRIVFGFPGQQLRPLYGDKLPFRSLAMGAGTVAAAGGGRMALSGPWLDELAAAPHLAQLEQL